VLTELQTVSFFRTLKNLAAGGKSLILITHKLRGIKQLADRVAVLRRGELAGIRNTGEIDEHEIAKMMIGEHEIQEEKYTAGKNRVTSGPVIVFDNVTVQRRGQERPLLDKVSFTVQAGEILGFTGVGGNGLGALEAALGGFLHPASGAILHRGKDISRLNIRRLRNQGLAYVPADRLQVGSALGATVDENVMINRRREFTRMGFLDKTAIREYTGACVRRYNISESSDIGAENALSLSGGSLQKLILAREIDQRRDYIVFSEPSWGLDIAAGEFVRKEIAALRDNGAAVILISTNPDEALSLADRIIVMYRGKTAGQFENNGTDAGKLSLKERIGACMQGLGGEI
jgi:simple sugar transport system ATP-binding protein